MQRVVAQLPWGHNIELLTGLSDPADRLWYAEQALAHGWSRDVLGIQIKSKLHLRAGAALDELRGHAAAGRVGPRSPADQGPVSPRVPRRRRGSERAGRRAGPDRAGRAVPARARPRLRLRRAPVPAERRRRGLLRRPAVLPHPDQAVRRARAEAPPLHSRGRREAELLRQRRRRRHCAATGENPTIGLLLCRTRNEVVVRYALSGVAAPMAVAGYRLAELPPEARAALPGEDELLGAVDAVVEGNDECRG